MVYVSITGLQIKSPLHAARFWYHAIRSMIQAQTAPGNLRAETRMINGVHHTLSVWQTEAHMRAYLKTGSHLAATKAFHRMATGKTLGFSAEQAPDWDQVPSLWRSHAQQVQPPA